jgi:hypothetical protein
MPALRSGKALPPQRSQAPTISDESSQLGSTAKNRFEPELAAKLGVTFALSNAAVSAALGLRAYSASHEVRVNGAPTLLVPLVAPLVSIEYRFAARN